MKYFTLYWKNGKREVIKGYDYFQAMDSHGYIMSIRANVAFYKEGVDDNYIWTGTQWMYKGYFTQQRSQYETSSGESFVAGAVVGAAIGAAAVDVADAFSSSSTSEESYSGGGGDFDGGGSSGDFDGGGSSGDW